MNKKQAQLMLKNIMGNMPDPDKIVALPYEQFIERPWAEDYDSYEAYLAWTEEKKGEYKAMQSFAEKGQYAEAFALALKILRETPGVEKTPNFMNPIVSMSRK